MLLQRLDAKFVVYAALVLASSFVLRILYRLLAHPLRKFPGPKLAAATYWYEKYYDVFKDGTGLQFPEHVQQLHREYGEHLRKRQTKVSAYWGLKTNKIVSTQGP